MAGSVMKNPVRLNLIKLSLSSLEVLMLFKLFHIFITKENTSGGQFSPGCASFEQWAPTAKKKIKTDNPCPAHIFEIIRLYWNSTKRCFCNYATGGIIDGAMTKQ
jgi:hypothetical protein